MLSLLQDQSINIWDLPSRVRADDGGENVAVEGVLVHYGGGVMVVLSQDQVCKTQRLRGYGMKWFTIYCSPSKMSFCIWNKWVC